MTNLDELIRSLDKYETDFTLGTEHITDMEGYTKVSFTTCGADFEVLFDNAGRFVGIKYERG